MIYKIRVTGEVLETPAATRRVTVDGEVMTFGREAVYIDADELPVEIATDPLLRIETVDAAPAGVRPIQKKRRPRPDELDNRPNPSGNDDPDDITRLRSERVEKGKPDDIERLRSERVEKPESKQGKKHN